MIVSWKWLGAYVDLNMPVAELCERLALSGLNHESTTPVGDDFAIDLEVTSNRADCLSHLGVAREVAVLYGKPAPDPASRPAEAGPAAASLAGVTVDVPELCGYFTGRVVSGVTIAESPAWLKERLETLGIRPVSNIVDITNYVMFECGQPLHAYDLDRLEGRRLVVRKAGANERLKAINGKTYELDPEMLVIADATRPVGLAGVMGGLETEIGPGTQRVLIESALFDPVSVRRTSRALGLASPSSFRFERGLDPARTAWANDRCAELILELAGGTLHPGRLEVGEPPVARPVVTLREARIARILGIEIPLERAIEILESLGLELVERDTLEARFRAPTWRPDLTREIDLIEEVARINGYHHIPEDRVVPLARSARAPRERLDSLVREGLSGLGFDEAYTFSLVAEPLDTPVAEGVPAPSLKVDHSSRKKENALRQSVVPSLLAARAHNEAHGVPDAPLFEIATVYRPRPDGHLPDEPVQLGIVSGLDFHGLKGVVETLLDKLHVSDRLTAKPAAPAVLAAERSAELYLGSTRLGYIGEVDRAWRDRHGLRAACSAAELDLQTLQDRAVLVPQNRPLPAFPVVTRDLSLVVDQTTPWSEIEAAVRASGGPLLDDVAYLDTFQGGNLPTDRQSVHLGMRFLHPERTLTSEEVEAAVQNVIRACEAQLKAELRS